MKNAHIDVNFEMFALNSMKESKNDFSFTRKSPNNVHFIDDKSSMTMYEYCRTCHASIAWFKSIVATDFQVYRNCQQALSTPRMKNKYHKIENSVRS